MFVDSYEKLVVVNGFERAMKFLKEMTELCSKNRLNLIVQIDQNKLEKEKRATVEKVIRPL